ncbi:MAG: PD-(D/E)XK nuclease family protein [Bacteroidales bacterium]|jgi:hypothetical protein|nr:PD-(D/E)XK nuclease family protein [Bacteroidales bacterium]
MENETFLHEVARDLYEKFGKQNELSNIVIITPSKRVKLFINKYFMELSGRRPLWAPRYMNVVHLCEEKSSLRLYDDEIQRIALIWELYLAYKTVREQTRSLFDCPCEVEPFEDFYFFGEVLLQDFDDIDRHIVSAEQVYKNMADLKRLDSLNYLTEEQKAIIKRFFNMDVAEKSKLQQNFFNLWNILSDTYTLFKKNLILKNMAYEGMLIREIAERLTTMDRKTRDNLFPEKKYVFAGFNYLSKAEYQLFECLKDKSLFYWDYDEYYMDTEAGKYLKQYSRLFPDALQGHDRALFAKDKEITLIESANPVEQTGYIEPWLNTIHLNYEQADTAIVLGDAKILPTVLSQLPENLSPNIAILYTLFRSRIAGLLMQLTELQVKGVRGHAFDFDYLLPVLKNQFTRHLYKNALKDIETIQRTKRLYIVPNTELLIVEDENKTEPVRVLMENTLFRITRDTKELVEYLRQFVEKIAESRVVEDPLEISALTEAYKMLNRLETIAQHVNKKEAILKLLKRLLLSVKISYAGEPAKGLQIMGMSDTRNIDFKNVLLISANDGVIPKIDPGTSFIPPFLRKAFGLPTIEEQDSMEAYQFYRLLQRAEHVALSYSVGKNIAGKGEMSRYLRQLLFESPHKKTIKKITLKSQLPSTAPENHLEVQKNNEMLHLLKIKYNGDVIENNRLKALSPSAFNRYIDCPLSFYFKYVLNINVPDNLDTALNAASLGSIFHKTMEKIYAHTGIIDPNFLDKYIKHEEITSLTVRLLEEAFVEEYFKTPTSKDEYDGEQNIYFQVIARMVRNTLLHDRYDAPFEILGLEKPCYFKMKITDDIEIWTGGIIDRLDKINGTVRVIDYKTGSVPTVGDYAKEIPDIFKNDRKKKTGYQFQTFLYSSILSETTPLPVVPALLFPLAADSKEYSPILKIDDIEITDFNRYKDLFMENFKEKLAELFNPEIPFSPCEKDTRCRYCDYKNICNKDING